MITTYESALFTAFLTCFLVLFSVGHAPFPFHFRGGAELRFGPNHFQPRCEIEPLFVASMATTLLEGLVSSALAGNELFESLFRAAGPCLLVEAWRDAGAPRAFDGIALLGWSPNAGHLLVGG